MNGVRMASVMLPGLEAGLDARAVQQGSDGQLGIAPLRTLAGQDHAQAKAGDDERLNHGFPLYVLWTIELEQLARFWLSGHGCRQRADR